MSQARKGPGCCRGLHGGSLSGNLPGYFFKNPCCRKCAARVLSTQSIGVMVSALRDAERLSGSVWKGDAA
jgi:hypothetical protein